MARERRRFVRDAFLQVAVGHDRVDAIIGDRHVRRVERRGVKLLRDGETDRVARALAERAGGDFNAFGLVALGMAGSEAAPLAEILELVERHLLETGQVQQRINQHRAVARRENKAIAIGPLRVLRIELQVLRPEHKREIGAAHGQTAVAALRFLHRIDREGADGIGNKGFDWVGGEVGGFLAHSGVKLARRKPPVYRQAL